MFRPVFSQIGQHERVAIRSGEREKPLRFCVAIGSSAADVLHRLHGLLE